MLEFCGKMKAEVTTMNEPMKRLCALIYGADDGLSGLSGLEEVALLQLERMLDLANKLRKDTNQGL